MKHRLLICAALVLLAILAAVIFDRVWLAERELQIETEDASLRDFPAVLEAQGYFEEIKTPKPTPAQALTPAEEEKAEEIMSATLVEDGYGVDYIYAAVSNGAGGGNHKVVMYSCPCSTRKATSSSRPLRAFATASAARKSIPIRPICELWRNRP